MQVNTEPTSLTGAGGLPGGIQPDGPAGPGPAASTDAEKAAALRRMKMLALSLLIVMAVIFVIAFAFQEQYPWLEYVRAAAEGGMVGALADWFAVTALFKYPMGIKIPHTAIIPRRKDQIGASLGQFVEYNFLSEEVVQAKIRTLGISHRAGSWLARQENADRVAREGAAAIRGAMLVLNEHAAGGPREGPGTVPAPRVVLNDRVAGDIIESRPRRYVLAPPWGPPLGRL